MSKQTISPLRVRMTEDMTVRGFTASTQRGYPRLRHNPTLLASVPKPPPATHLTHR